LNLDGLKIVVDCANGAAYKVGPTMLAELGAEVFPLGVEPNGRNINRDCGSLHPERLAAKVQELRADVGIAVDGDADRVVIVSERGELVDGDALLALCARDLHERGALRGGGVVATVMSNLGLERALAELGLELVRTQVGDRYVVEEMRRSGYNLGGEQSGHLIFLDHASTGDGIIGALQVLALMLRTGTPLSELAKSAIERVPQVLENVALPARRPLDEMRELQRACEGVRAALGRDGRLLVRWSGTEPKLRIMIEGPDEDRLRTWAKDLAGAARRDLGA
jgi:phosphoglucosamine mutase